VTEDNRRIAIGQELRHALAAQEAAYALAAAKLYNDALSRLCYALYHHLVALLLTEGVEPKRHGALPGLLGQHFVQRGILDSTDVTAVGHAIASRQLADYERTWDADGTTWEAERVPMERVIAKVEGILRAGGWSGP
jgi:uncharacterized protein (UPF0332 family)